MNKCVCIHSHFYQPPRENPWLEEIEVQDSAYPYRDWNERITAECYNPNTAARILINNNTIVDIRNNYKKISFNFGPTLISWMERSAPEVYERIQLADRESRDIFSGHGSAIAQVYNHMIMPLSNSQDKKTQIIWGKQDFIHRFNREPEGMWLAETAVDLESLELLAEQGIKYTILAPRQAAKIKKTGESEWIDVSDSKIDPKRSYRCNLPSGNSIAIFFYDGNISQDLAFGDLMSSGENLANRLINSFSECDEVQLANIATDGETYGHHSRHGDMALAYCLNYIEENKLADITNYGEYLEKHPPEWEVEIIENTSWSCIHGVERWKNNCGCNSGGHPGWTQEWRAPLRSTLDWLRDNLIELYQKEVSVFTDDVWKLRDDYIHIILNREENNITAIFKQNNIRAISSEQRVKLLKLLEMQRHTMLMYTSCGWFFDEISGIETVQILQYAARAIQLAKEITGKDFEPEFINHLKDIKSNLPYANNGENVYNRYVKPAVVDLLRVAAHYAISSLFEENSVTKIFSYDVNNKQFQKYEAGKQRMIIGKSIMRSEITYEETDVSYAFLYAGAHNINGGIREHINEEAFGIMKAELESAFEHLDIAQIILLMDKHLGNHDYSLNSLFKDKKREIFSTILIETQKDAEYSLRHIFENHYSTLLAMKEMQIPIPKSLFTAVEETINADLKRAFEANGDFDSNKLQNIINEVSKWEISVDKERLALIGTNKVTSLMKSLWESPDNVKVMSDIKSTLTNLYKLNIDPDIWEAQNIFYLISKDVPEIEGLNKYAREQFELFYSIQDLLRVKVK